MVMWCCMPRCVVLLRLPRTRHVLQCCVAALVAFQHGWQARVWCGELHCSRGLARLRMAWG